MHAHEASAAPEPPLELVALLLGNGHATGRRVEEHQVGLRELFAALRSVGDWLNSTVNSPVCAASCESTPFPYSIDE
jgi:hypothetical protein